MFGAVEYWCKKIAGTNSNKQQYQEFFRGKNKGFRNDAGLCVILLVALLLMTQYLANIQHILSEYCDADAHLSLPSMLMPSLIQEQFRLS